MNDFLILLIFLVGAHLIGDVIVRPPIVHRFKAVSNLVMFFHCYIWAIIVSIPLVVFNKFEVWKFLFLFGGHLGVDKWKGEVDPDADWVKGDGSNISTSKYTYVDQGLHFIQLLIVAI